RIRDARYSRDRCWKDRARRRDYSRGDEVKNGAGNPRSRVRATHAKGKIRTRNHRAQQRALWERRRYVSRQYSPCFLYKYRAFDSENEASVDRLRAIVIDLSSAFLRGSVRTLRSIRPPTLW